MNPHLHKLKDKEELLREALAAWLLTFGLEGVPHTITHNSDWYQKYARLFVATGHFLRLLEDAGWLSRDERDFKGLTQKALDFIAGGNDEQPME